ncbi:DUF6385 domain-containing protein [Paenibacillus wynnii]|uniref:DUF6385 domain-containing protein n=1 Tax=Paenibacillus wynnii TaxID=268407 RepID=UPI00278D49F0|nr:DUF6385 domain-containing protein [Paenibacillus wynnii]MDQ0194828.1 hypothetical protein [Paenibacillus wynnii]
MSSCYKRKNKCNSKNTKRTRPRKKKGLQKSRHATKTQIWGKYKRTIKPILTDRKGRLITIDRVVWFREQKENVVTGADFTALPLQNISLSNQYVYSVQNTGDYDAEVRIEMGPDASALTDDIGLEIIPAKQTKIVTPLRFSKFIRILYRSAIPGTSTHLSIVFQAQDHYWQKVARRKITAGV